jgi:hypothetical protein
LDTPSTDPKSACHYRQVTLLWKEYPSGIRKCEFGITLTLEINEQPIGVFRMTLSCYYLEIPREHKSNSPYFASEKESFLSAEKWAYIIEICNQKPGLKSMTKLFR